MALEDEIRNIAHRIWDEEGRPEGRDLEHWLKAEFIWNETHKTVGPDTEPQSLPTAGRLKNKAASTKR